MTSDVNCVIPPLSIKLPHDLSDLCLHYLHYIQSPYPHTPLRTNNMSGTQSPPLEFTGEETTLGAPATNKPAGAANVKPDAEQRGGE